METVILIKHISVIQNTTGPDRLIFETNLPSGIFPFDGKASLQMDIASGSGVEYCRKNFTGVPISTYGTNAKHSGLKFQEKNE